MIEPNSTPNVVSIRPSLINILSVAFAAYFWVYYGAVAGTVCVAALTFMGRKRLLTAARTLGTSLSPRAWSVIGLVFVVLCSASTYQAFHAYRTRDNLRRVSGAAGHVLPNGHLQFSGRNVTDGNLEAVSLIRIFEVLELHTTNVTGDGLKWISEWGQLKRLYLNNSPIGNDGLQYLSNLSELETLEVQHVGMTDASIRHLRGLKSLRKLRLNMNRAISDSALEDLCALPRLEELYLDGTSVTDAGLLHLAGTPSLKTLVLMDTAVTTAGVATLQSKLPQCQIFWDNGLPFQIESSPLK